MAWNDTPPTAQELKAIQTTRWDATPPTKEELAAINSPEGKPSGFLDTANAALQTYENKISWGHLPEIEAALQKAANPKNDYTELVNKNRQELTQLQERNPKVTALASGAGVVRQAGLMGTLASVTGPQTFLGRVALSGGIGAVQGGLQNPNDNADQSVFGPMPTEGLAPAKRAVGAVAGGIVGAGAQAAGEGLSWVGTKIAAKLAGVPSNAAEIYGDRGEEVRKLVNKEGGVLPAAADQMKKKVVENVQATNQGLNELKDYALGKSDEIGRSIPIQGVLEHLEKVKSGMDSYHQSEAISEIDDMIKYVKNQTPDGLIDLRNLVFTRNHLDTLAKGAYAKNGELIHLSPEGSKIAAGARKVVTDLVHEVSPEYAYADAVQTDLHRIAQQMKRSLLAQGGSENVFASAGGGLGNENQMMLQKIDTITGGNSMKNAELLYAAKAMKNDSLIEGTRQAALKMGLDVKRISKPLYAPSIYGAVPFVSNAVQRRLEQKK